MSFMKRSLIYLLIILLALSIYNDLDGKPRIEENNSKNTHLNINTKFTIMHIKIQPGDTVLTIVEQINPNKFQILNIAQIITDFQLINPTVDPHHLQPHSFYYFPKY